MYNRLIVFCCVIFIAVLNSSCTLHFKATDLELDSETPKGTIGSTNDSETTYRLAAIDLAKNDQ